VRQFVSLLLSLAIIGRAAAAQSADTSSGSKTFFTKRDLVIGGAGLVATGILSAVDPPIARWSQEGRTYNPDGSDKDGLSKFARNVSKVNETTLTATGIVVYAIGRLSHGKTTADIGLHATESVVLASLLSQAIRGPLGRTRPYVTKDSNQYKFKPFRGFYGDSSFDYRAFPSIHTSSSMAIAKVLTLELNRRHSDATPYVAPLLFVAGMLPGLARIRLDQHWTSDVVAGAVMGVWAGHKVVTYSHDHPNNRFDRTLLGVSVVPDGRGRVEISFNPSF